MTLRELLNSGIVIEGYRQIQCWETEDNPTVYYEGTDSGEDNLEEYMEKEVTYLFSAIIGGSTPCIVIEISE